MNLEKRIPGFDLLRLVALLIVIFKHTSSIFGESFQIFMDIMPDPVDIFFALSGFLIGNIFIQKFILTNNLINLKTIVVFILRRWFRTLPNYYLFLLLNIILIYFGLIPGYLNKYLITYFVLFQNLFKHYDFLYWEAWSLVVEEWFYFIFPTLIFLFSRFNLNIKIKYILVSLCLFFFSFLFRFFCDLSHDYNVDSFNLIRKLVLARFDILALGLLAAYLFNFHKNLFFKQSKFLFIFGILGLIFVKKSCLSQISSLLFLLNAMFIVILFPQLIKLNLKINISIVLSKLSNYSFAAYLFHLPLFHLMINFYKPTGSVVGIFYFMYFLLIYFVSKLIYSNYQLKFINFRDKYIP